MKKKAKFLIGGGILFISLFINFIFSGKLNSSDVTFDNIDALAENESGDKPKPTCILSGFICSGIDKDGNMGTFYGLDFEH